MNPLRTQDLRNGGSHFGERGEFMTGERGWGREKGDAVYSRPPLSSVAAAAAGAASEGTQEGP